MKKKLDKGSKRRAKERKMGTMIMKVLWYHMHLGPLPNGNES